MSCPCPQDFWPEPIIRVQSISDSGSPIIPDRYIKPNSERPNSKLGLSIETNTTTNISSTTTDSEVHLNIPLIDFEGYLHNLQDVVEEDDHKLILPDKILNQICMACKEWGFFQIVHHGVNPDLMNQVRDVWRQFFHLPFDEKQIYANTPKTYEGYGSRLGTEKGAILDWNDYFFLHYLPHSLKDYNKWPALPSSCR